ncbi:MAG: ABC transporter permease subunit [Bacteroidetes bacterium]|nr:ABC transporter permease subunit [Bacteroidota bacterium]
MTQFTTILRGLAAVSAFWAFLTGMLAFAETDRVLLLAAAVLLSAAFLPVQSRNNGGQYDLAASLFGMVAVLMSLRGGMPSASWGLVIASWLYGWLAVEKSMAIRGRSRFVELILSLAVPVFFGVWIIFVWECLTIGLEIPMVLLPPPSAIAVRFAESTPILWADFQQTVIKSALVGYVLGCGSAFILAVLIDRVPFLQRGLLPIGNFISALPIVGIAPIMVLWFGFDWESKAAVVVVMTFFPMLVNTVAGLQATQAMERDLLRTYASSYVQLLFKLRLPAAAPFIFNALKINSTLALIGAIVAEFFGTPIVGLGFRISTEVGRMNVDMAWAEICVAALAGSLSYGLLSLLEKRVTFWHPSNRQKQV